MFTYRKRLKNTTFILVIQIVKKIFWGIDLVITGNKESFHTGKKIGGKKLQLRQNLVDFYAVGIDYHTHFIVSINSILNIIITIILVNPHIFAHIVVLMLCYRISYTILI
jgi:hypothetical protein